MSARHAIRPGACFRQKTSAENEMSLVQLATIAGERILLIGDAGRGALTEAGACATALGLGLQGVNRFQVPHHGSRRTNSSAVLDLWLGPKLRNQPAKGQGTFTAVVREAKMDEDHPRKSSAARSFTVAQTSTARRAEPSLRSATLRAEAEARWRPAMILRNRSNRLISHGTRMNSNKELE